MIWASFAHTPGSSGSSWVPWCQGTITVWDPEQEHPNWPSARLRRRRKRSRKKRKRRSCPSLHQTWTVLKKGQRLLCLFLLPVFFYHISPNIFWSTLFFSAFEFRRWFSEAVEGIIKLKQWWSTKEHTACVFQHNISLLNNDCSIYWEAMKFKQITEKQNTRPDTKETDWCYIF